MAEVRKRLEVAHLALAMVDHRNLTSHTLNE